MTRSPLSRLPLQLLRANSLAPPSLATAQTTKECKLPTPTDHPIRFAQTLIDLALCLQQIEADTSELPLGLPVRDAGRRYIEIASHRVTAQDSLVYSLDGVETLLKEASYYVNEGKLDTAWLVLRRGLAIAQLIGVTGMPGTRPDLLWLYLISADRHLSMVLGLSSAKVENTFARESLLATETYCGRLARLHTVLLGRIIRRNENLQRRHRCLEPLDKEEVAEYDNTLGIDCDLKMAVRLLPVDWWIVPDLKDAVTNVAMTDKTNTLVAQLHHHYLVVALHQPYAMIQTAAHRDFTYSKLAVPPASREMLARFVILRSFYRSLAYRAFDDKAFFAAVTLLLAHIDGHRLGRENVLEHLRPQDLVVVKQTLQTIEELSRRNDDNLSRSHTEILTKLIKIEARAADGTPFISQIVDGETDIGRQEGMMLPMPYFGTIWIASTQQAGLPAACSNMKKWAGYRDCRASGSALIPGMQLCPPVLDDRAHGNSVNCGSYTDLPPLFPAQELNPPNERGTIQEWSFPGARTASNSQL